MSTSRALRLLPDRAERRSGKAIVALGQTYFAVQTRRQELADIASLSEAQKRLMLRDQVAERNTALAATAQAAGDDPINISIFVTRLPSVARRLLGPQPARDEAH